MKVLFDHSMPFLLTHGGFQIQIEQTKAALETVGVEVEYLRWWDERQTGDIVHCFGRPWAGYVEQAHGKGMKVIITELLTGMGSRTAAQRLVQRAVIRITQAVLPRGFLIRLAWDSFRLADASIALTPWEAQLLMEMYDAPAERVYVVPNGVESVFFNGLPEKRSEWLICTATITERKRVLETAEAAVLAKVPLWVIGRPYTEKSDYMAKFRELCGRHRDLIRYEGAIADRQELARAYRRARGFVLLSTMESLSLSALEAAACECRLLLSDLPWARTHFAERANYCRPDASREQTATALRRFYEAAPQLPTPPRPKTWGEIGVALREIYTSVTA